MHHRCEQSHGDLFVDTGNGDLITYDLPLEGLNRIIEMSVLGARFFFAESHSGGGVQPESLSGWIPWARCIC
jgi:hypothetical protein